MIKPTFIVALASVCLSTLTVGAEAQGGVGVDVTAGKVAVTDWVVEQRLDLAAVARLLGREGPVQAEKVRVIEVDAQGNKSGTMAFQLDTAQTPGEFVVTWRMPGQTNAGQTRHFQVVLDGEGEPPAPDQPIDVTTEENRITIVNGPVTLEHDREFGGMIRHVTVGQTQGALRWNDRVNGDWYWKGKLTYRLADHRAEHLKVLSAGPLRVVVEARSEYLAAGNPASSHPRATYRFTTYAGQPVTHVEVNATQDYARRWYYLNLTDIDLREASLGSYDTQAGKWAAGYSDDLLVGVTDGPAPGKTEHGVSVAPTSLVWRTLNRLWKTTLVWGGGKGDAGLLRTWAAISDSPPTAAAHFAPIEAQVAELTVALTSMQEGLAGLRGMKWAVVHVATAVAGAHLRDAATQAAAGRFVAAEQALARAEAILRVEPNDTDLRKADGVVAGMVGGYPYLGNDQAAYIWSHVDDGAGLLSIHDRRTDREFLNVPTTAARLWEISVEKGEGGTSYSNVKTPCSVRHQPHGLVLTWKGPATVRVRATLDPDQAVLRMRLNGLARQLDEGILTVIFPLVDGILPVTPGGTDDTLLDSIALGHQRASPLVTGKSVWSYYPHSMQFNAMYGNGQGLYAAEHDPEAHTKDLVWSGQHEFGTLNFSIFHPVADWAGPELVKDYASPGDVVIGPFEGNWYDAALLYRKWALTAPWCSKGPIYARTDYPKWLARAPYWTIGSTGSEDGVKEEIDVFDALGVPIGVSHLYGYWYAPHQDDRYPEYFPPRLGTEGFKEAVAQIQQKGMRVVPYVNGFLWDQDTESWRTKNAGQGAVRGPEDQLLILPYGSNPQVAMCPGSTFWRDTLTDVSEELVGRYGVSGVYYDFLSAQRGDCYNPEHGHHLCGGRFWSQSIRDLYGHIRQKLKQLDPDVILAGEFAVECVIDVLDAQLAIFDESHQGLPLFQAVYHGYALVYGAPGSIRPYRSDLEPHNVGRWWLQGNQNGWHNAESIVARVQAGDPDHQKWRPHADNYVKLLHCHYHFGRPYLAYGQMLRPPLIEGDVPTMKEGRATFPVVEGSAWKAPDGSVGVFFLNYDKGNARQFSWTVDLLEGAGWDPDTDVTLSRWTREEGLVHLADVAGGELRRKENLEPWGLIALKLEATK